MQTTNDQNRLLLVQLHLFTSDCEGRVEPLLERVARLEDRREQEVQQGPQLGQLVLQWSLKRQFNI